MYKNKFIVQGLAVVCLMFACAALAPAASRVFVSTGGNDNNSCGRNQPCRTFTAAVAAVDTGGEVVVLDSGGYGAVTITKSVQITAPEGIHAAITQNNGNAISVAAGVGDTVVLRGLTLSGSNNLGINFDSGAELFVENCVISNFFRGILFDAPGKLVVENTSLRNNFVGILTDAASGNVQAEINRTSIENGNLGVSIGANTKALITYSNASNNNFNGFSVIKNGVLTINHSTAAHNGQNGFASEGGLSAVLNVDYCTATGNGNAGIIAGGGAQVTARVSNSTATDNAIGFAQLNISIFESYGNNRVRGNTTNVSGVLTTVGEI